ncbi:immediate early response gene 2 protein-like [Polymixia lowei]
MEVSAEAKRIMIVALGKLYSSRTQRGGLALHRSLVLTLLMRSARDIYHAARESTPQPTDTDTERDRLQGDAPPSSHVGDSTEHSDPDSTEHSDPDSTEHSDPDSTEHRDPDSTEHSDPDSTEHSDPDSTEHSDPDSTEHSDPWKMPGGPEDKENRGRKRRCATAAEPDFLPCKKAKLEQGKGLQQIALNSVLMNYVNCGSEVGAYNAVHTSRAIASF